MFGLGTTELLIILAMVLLVFGAKKIPELGRGLGSGLRSFREGLKGEPEGAAEEPPKALDADSDQKN
tara:strand:+ start:247 stop:447 length:201 start_codon:yes stop_codon:yes gene_type:complete